MCLGNESLRIGNKGAMNAILVKMPFKGAVVFAFEFAGAKPDSR